MAILTGNDIRANFIREFNLTSIHCNQVLNEFSILTKNKIVLPNCVKAYQEKIIEIDDLFREHDLQLFDISLLFDAINTELTLYHEISLELLNKVTEKLNNPLAIASLKFGTGKLFLNMSMDILKAYELSVQMISSYDIKANLYKATQNLLLKMFGGLHEPSFYSWQGDAIIDAASKIGAIQTSEYNKTKLLELLNVKELESLRYAKLHNDQNATDEDFVENIQSILACFINSAYPDEEQRQHELDMLDEKMEAFLNQIDESQK